MNIGAAAAGKSSATKKGPVDEGAVAPDQMEILLGPHQSLAVNLIMKSPSTAQHSSARVF